VQRDLSGDELSITLTAQSLDANDRTFQLHSLPKRGTLYPVSSSGVRADTALSMTAGAHRVNLTGSSPSLIYVVTPAGGGPAPFDVFTFSATDRVGESNVGTVTIHVACPVSQYNNVSDGRLRQFY
jgi:hypothetical protein